MPPEIASRRTTLQSGDVSITFAKPPLSSMITWVGQICFSQSSQPTRPVIVVSNFRMIARP